MNNLTPELIAKAKAAKSLEELLELAKENGVDLTEDEAKTCFEQLHANVEVSDDELEAVSGGFNCGNENDSEADVTDSKLDMNIDNEKNNSRFT